MMKHLPFLFCLCTITIANAQTELVPNGSFEILSSCPDAGNQIERAVGWFNCRETPDLCNACFTYINNGFDVPQNNFGWQYASDGVGYADLWTYAITELYREFIGYPLLQPLVPGNTYKVSFKCTPGTLNGYSLATNNIGVRFSTVAYSESNPAPIDNFAHLKIDTVVTDTSIWTAFSQYWTADSSYQYILLGNFYDDDYTDTIDSYLPFSPFGVYYVDEVSVTDEGKDAITEVAMEQFLISWQKNSLIIEGNGSIIQQAIIYDLVGKKLFDIHLTDSAAIIDCSSFSKGMYLLTIKSKGKQFVKKFYKS